MRNNKLLNTLAAAIRKTAEKEANSACMLIGYQPKKPESLKKNVK